MTSAKWTLSEAQYVAYRQTRSFDSLDGLRCLSILAVVWHHSLTSAAQWRILNLGFLGVDLFFVISGFLIVTLLLRERATNGSISLQKFYIRRTLRIFPLYYGLILGMAAYYVAINTSSRYGQQFIRDLPEYLTYTANFVPVGYGIVWSLATEEQFYLLWPSIERYCQRAVIPVLIGAILLNQCVNLPVGKQAISNLIGSSDWTRLLVTQTTFTPILLGVCVAHALHDRRSYGAMRFLASSAWAPAIYLAALVTLMAAMPDDLAGLPRLSLQFCMALLLMSCVYQEQHVLRRFLIFPPIREIGRISYGIYLLHIEVIAFVMHLAGSILYGRPLLSFAIELAATVALAEVSFRFYESPILSFKRRFSVVHQTHF